MRFRKVNGRKDGVEKKRKRTKLYNILKSPPHKWAKKSWGIAI
jgi:hypothetical protein